MLELPEEPVRLEVVSQAPAGKVDGESAASVDAPTEALCRRARDPEDRGRVLALRALRRRLDAPVVAVLLDELRATTAIGEPSAAIRAIEALTELRDGGAVPALIGRLDGVARAAPGLAEAIQAALVVLTAQDFGRSRRRWLAWAGRNAERPRVEWLLEGLSHKSPEIRLAAAEDLRLLSGDSFGYLFDMPKREREAARRRWAAWWSDQPGRGELAADPRKADGPAHPPGGIDTTRLGTAPPGNPPSPAPAAPPSLQSGPSQPFPLPPAPKAR
jgi:hypothetical protein